MLNEIWDQIREAIKTALTTQETRYRAFLGGKDLSFHRVSGGEPSCWLEHTSGGASPVFQVRVNWLYDVHQEGLALVNGVLVLNAQIIPATEGAEHAWIALVAVPTVKDLKAGSSVLTSTVQLNAQPTYIVRLCGFTCAGKTQEEALAGCRQLIEERLLPTEQDERALLVAPFYHQTRGKKP